MSAVYIEQLIVVQRLIDSVSDHIEDSLTITHEFQHPHHAHRGKKWLSKGPSKVSSRLLCRC